MKTIRGTFRSTVVFALAAMLMIGNAYATSANTDLTDIWWNKNKSGNGYQFINTGTFVFATAYLYGVNRQPFWISAELQRTGSNTYSGPLYVTSGPYYGGPYDPATVTFRQAGTMTFVAASINSGQLTYSVDGVFVNEPVERQPLTLDFYGGSYRNMYTLTATGCFDPALNTSATAPIEISITQNGASMTQAWDFGDFTCSFTGTYSQLGRMGSFDSSYTCQNGGAGTLLMFQMTNEPFMFMARTNIHNTVNGCSAVGHLVGVIPQ